MTAEANLLWCRTDARWLAHSLDGIGSGVCAVLVCWAADLARRWSCHHPSCLVLPRRKSTALTPLAPTLACLFAAPQRCPIGLQA